MICTFKNWNFVLSFLSIMKHVTLHHYQNCLTQKQLLLWIILKCLFVVKTEARNQEKCVTWPLQQTIGRQNVIVFHQNIVVFSNNLLRENNIVQDI